MEHQLDLGNMPQLVRSGFGHNHVGSIHYRLDEWWSLLLFTYDAEVELDHRHYAIHPGTVILVPPHVVKHYQCTEAARHYFAHFRLVKSKHNTASIHECFQTMTLQKSFINDFQLIIEAQTQQRQHAAQIHLWHLLQRISHLFGQHKNLDGIHPAAERALQFIEAHMAQTISLQDIATHVGVSSNYLNTLFKQHFGETVYACLLRMRMDKAHYLIVHSDMKINEIADELGVADLQAFNKLVRKHLGKSPRKLRESVS